VNACKKVTVMQRRNNVKLRSAIWPSGGSMGYADVRPPLLPLFDFMRESTLSCML